MPTGALRPRRSALRLFGPASVVFDMATLDATSECSSLPALLGAWNQAGQGNFQYWPANCTATSKFNAEPSRRFFRGRDVSGVSR
ncbi:hypothetical protein WDL1P1_00786 (plasmid) [Variovorax sp. WDL1]|nr:hypothetical protein WDL1P1_00786 [Variovorax sp. WDL1]